MSATFTAAQHRGRSASKIAQLKRDPDNPQLRDELVQCQADYHEAKIREHVQKLLRGAPPLSWDQRDRLARLFGDAA